MGEKNSVSIPEALLQASYMEAMSHVKKFIYDGSVICNCGMYSPDKKSHVIHYHSHCENNPRHYEDIEKK